MSKNAPSADNQQGSLLNLIQNDPSETTRQAPLSKKAIKAYLLGSLHDGTFSSNKRFRISQRGTEWLKILKDLEIETGKVHNPSKKVDPNYWRMYVLTNSQKTFVKTIRSWHPRKIKTLRKRMKI